jgi:hypothetical protein
LQSLSNGDLYAVTAYVFYLNDIIEDEHFELNANSFKPSSFPTRPTSAMMIATSRRRRCGASSHA